MPKDPNGTSKDLQGTHTFLNMSEKLFKEPSDLQNLPKAPHVSQKTSPFQNINNFQPQGEYLWSDKDLFDSHGAITAVDLLNIDTDQTLAIRIKYGESWSQWHRTCISQGNSKCLFTNILTYCDSFFTMKLFSYGTKFIGH